MTYLPPATKEKPEKALPLTATKRFECWYEYTSGLKQTLDTGMSVIVNDPDDERWDGEMMKPPYNGDVTGYLSVYEVVRVEGEVVKKTGKCGRTSHMNTARDYMRTFMDMVNAGSETPWDHETFYRDAKKRAASMEAEGRTDELKQFAQEIVKAFRDAPKNVEVA